MQNQEAADAILSRPFVENDERGPADHLPDVLCMRRVMATVIARSDQVRSARSTIPLGYRAAGAVRRPG